MGEPIPEIDANTRDWRCGMLAKAAISNGDSVLWWASTFNHATKRHRFHEAKTLEPLPGLKIRLLHGPGYDRNRSLKRLVHHQAIARAFAREATQTQAPDVVFCCLPPLELAEQAVTYGRNVGVPVLIDVRDLWPDHYLTLVPPAMRWLLKAILVREYQRAHRSLRGATGITAISNSFLDWGLRAAGRERHQMDGVFPMSYPVNLFSSSDKSVISRQKELITTFNLKPEDILITFVGTFTSSFDLQTAIEAARELEHTGRDNIRFVFVGDGEDGPQLRTQAQGLDNVIFAGWFDRVSIAAILGLSNIGLAPYRGDASMSLPNKPYEYMSAGLAILSSLQGELQDLIETEQIGLQYQAGTALSLVKAIDCLVANPEQLQMMKTRSHNLFKERFAANIVYSRLVRHLYQVSGGASIT